MASNSLITRSSFTQNSFLWEDYFFSSDPWNLFLIFKHYGHGFCNDDYECFVADFVSTALDFVFRFAGWFAPVGSGERPLCQLSTAAGLLRNRLNEKNKNKMKGPRRPALACMSMAATTTFRFAALFFYLYFHRTAAYAQVRSIAHRPPSSWIDSHDINSKMESFSSEKSFLQRTKFKNLKSSKRFNQFSRANARIQYQHTSHSWLAGKSVLFFWQTSKPFFYVADCLTFYDPKKTLPRFNRYSTISPLFFKSNSW